MIAETSLDFQSPTSDGHLHSVAASAIDNHEISALLKRSASEVLYEIIVHSESFVESTPSDSKVFADRLALAVATGSRTDLVAEMFLTAVSGTFHYKLDDSSQETDTITISESAQQTMLSALMTAPRRNPSDYHQSGSSDAVGIALRSLPEDGLLRLCYREVDHQAVSNLLVYAAPQQMLDRVLDQAHSATTATALTARYLAALSDPHNMKAWDESVKHDSRSVEGVIQATAALFEGIVTRHFQRSIAGDAFCDSVAPSWISHFPEGLVQIADHIDFSQSVSLWLMQSHRSNDLAAENVLVTIAGRAGKSPTAFTGLFYAWSQLEKPALLQTSSGRLCVPLFLALANAAFDPSVSAEQRCYAVDILRGELDAVHSRGATYTGARIPFHIAANTKSSLQLDCPYVAACTYALKEIDKLVVADAHLAARCLYFFHPYLIAYRDEVVLRRADYKEPTLFYHAAPAAMRALPASAYFETAAPICKKDRDELARILSNELYRVDPWNMLLIEQTSANTEPRVAATITTFMDSNRFHEFLNEYGSDFESYGAIIRLLGLWARNGLAHGVHPKQFPSAMFKGFIHQLGRSPDSEVPNPVMKTFFAHSAANHPYEVRALISREGIKQLDSDLNTRPRIERLFDFVRGATVDLHCHGAEYLVRVLNHTVRD